jgi:hypothetical protein
MKKAFAAAFYLLLAARLACAQSYVGNLPAWGPYTFAEGSTIGVVTDNPDGNTLIFINSLYPSIYPQENYTPVAGQWIDTPLSQFGVPSTAKAIFVGGVLIITGGSTTQNCDLTLTFRAPGSSSNAGAYIMQTISADTAGTYNGSRSMGGAWVPVVNGKIEWQWGRGDLATEYPSRTIGNYPAECAYGVNLNVEAYVR